MFDKIFLSVMTAFAIIVLINLWPAKTPYVTRKGTDIHETIWLWRVPTYLNHPAWYVRWNWRDGLTARAYCYDPEKSAEYRTAHQSTIAK